MWLLFFLISGLFSSTDLLTENLLCLLFSQQFDFVRKEDKAMTLSLSRALRRPSWMTPYGMEGMGDVFFDRLWPEWRRDLGEEWTPAVNIFEKDDNYHVTADLPGLNKDDISVTFEDGTITISGKKESSKEEKDANYYMKETRYGSFSRSFKVPGEVHADEVEATYKDGVLTVILPKSEESATKKIEVH
jgi:HSP20 family protein